MKIVAREWLLFLGLFVAGLVVPIGASMVLGGWEAGTWSKFYSLLADGHDVAWGFVLTPYMLVQLVRSVRWAIRIRAV